MEGHGAPALTAAEQWTVDWNANRIFDWSFRRADFSLTCPEDGDEFCGEVNGGVVLITSLPEPGGIPPLVYANSCSTVPWVRSAGGNNAGREPYGDRICTRGNDTLPGTFQREGNIAAWIGALDPTITGGMDTHHDAYMQDTLGSALALGDAFWKQMGLHVRGQPLPDWRDTTMTFFGDPAATYWGNPLDTRAYWPQAGRDWTSASAVSFAGPRSGRVLWTAVHGSPSSPPVVDGSGNVFVAGATHIVRIAADGSATASVPTAGAQPLQIALTTDGLVAASRTALRFADRGLAAVQTIGIPTPTVSQPPLVGPNGVMYLPLDSALLRVTPGDSRAIDTHGQPLGLAMTRSGSVVWTTSTGLRLYRQDRFGNVTERLLHGALAQTAPAVGPDGTIIFAGRAFVAAVRGIGRIPVEHNNRGHRQDRGAAGHRSERRQLHGHQRRLRHRPRPRGSRALADVPRPAHFRVTQHRRPAGVRVGRIAFVCARCPGRWPAVERESGRRY